MKTSPYLKLYSALIGIASIAILLQGVWAGVFLQHDGARDASAGWIDVHARGADFAIVLTLIATALAFVKLRARRELWIGGTIMAALLIFESYIGGLIRDNGKDTLTVVHVPSAMALMGLAVWLSFRSSSHHHAKLTKTNEPALQKV